MKVMMIPVVIGALGTIPKGRETGRLGNKRTRVNHPDYSIIKISQNSEKVPGDLETWCHSDSREKPSVNVGVKNSQRNNNNNNNNIIF